MQNQPDKTKEKETALKRALFHPYRIEIFTLLRKQGGTEAYLVDELELTAAQIAYHLKVLEDANLVADADSPEQGSADRYLIATPTW